MVPLFQSIFKMAFEIIWTTLLKLPISHGWQSKLIFYSQIYRGYVDDPRNTDNAWMETVAYNFHDNDGTKVGQFNLHAGLY